MDKPAMVYLEWLDINTSGDPWTENPNTLEPSPCFTLGWLICETDAHVNISATHSLDDNECHCLQLASIPKCCITRRVNLSPSLVS